MRSGVIVLLEPVIDDDLGLLSARKPFSIVPISGFLISAAALASILEDSFRLKAGTYEHAGDFDGSEGSERN